MRNHRDYGHRIVLYVAHCFFLGRLVQSTFEDLEDSGCIKVTEHSVEPLMLGSIASHYYLSYMTVSMFGSNIGPNTSLEVSAKFKLLLAYIILFRCAFKNLPLR